MFKFVIILIFNIFICASLLSGPAIELSKQGKTKYKIVFDEKSAILPEKTAKLELQNYLNRITGADFPVLSSKQAKGKLIVLGHNKLSKDFLGSKVIEKLGEEEFIIKSSKDGNIYITGGRPRGTLYGVYHFLDNVLGVRWLAPDAEFVPPKANLTISALNIREKPAYIQRDANYFLHIDPEADYKWLIRNRFNHTRYDQRMVTRKLKKKLYSKRWGIKKAVKIPSSEYGIKELYAPPYFVHTLYRLIPSKKYFKKHSDWWEEIDGKRVDKKHHSAMCLSNPGLIAETAKNAISQIDKYPDSKFISISENDGISAYCECQKCQALIKKYGNADSGLLLSFVNQVAENIHKKYPDIMVETLAYIKSEKPPKNIRAGKNILVRLCAWAISHSIPYNDTRSKKGERLFKRLKEWKTICPNMGIWDYVTTYAFNLIPHPNLNTIIPNLKAFYESGVNNYFYEGDHSHGGGYYSGEALARAFLISRGLWNPNSNTDKLITDFTNAYYGKATGKYIREYWKLLNDSNQKAKYTGMYQAGNNGEAPYLKLGVMLKSDKLLKLALQNAESKEHKGHVQQLQLQVNYVLLYNWRRFEKEAKKQGLKMPGTFDTFFNDFKKNTKKFKVFRINATPRKEVLSKLKNYYSMDFSVTASKSYGSKPEDAFDGNLKTKWNGSDFSGWLQVKFNKAKLIKSISTVFYRDKKVDYTILGSVDGKKWQTLVPRKTISTKKVIPKISTVRQILFADDKIKPVKVRYVKTKIFKAITKSGKRNWVVVAEQTID